MLRRFENFHIVLWLLKDTCWAAGIKPLGMFMILPTLGLAAWITYKNQSEKPELYHNGAILCWILANSLWMTSEFYALEGLLKPFVLLAFAAGLGLVAYYYAGRLRGVK